MYTRCNKKPYWLGTAFQRGQISPTGDPVSKAFLILGGIK